MRVERNSDEARIALTKVIVVLEKLCELYDAGEKEFVVCIGTILRTLLKTKGEQTKSLLVQTGKDGIQFADTSIKKRGEVSFWTINSGVHNLCVFQGTVYAGLLGKTISQTNVGVTLDFEPLRDRNCREMRWISLLDWYEQEVFCSEEFSMKRKDVIETITDLEGGAHYDEKITEEYARFRSPNGLDITIQGQPVHCDSNPVYVSLRQIAHEVLISFRNAGLR